MSAIRSRGIGASYEYASYDSVEVWTENRFGHDSELKFSCKATRPEKFLKHAINMLEPNTIMHLHAKFGIEYSTDEKAKDIDEQNFCLMMSFDVHQDQAVNVARLERFLEIVDDSIDLVYLHSQADDLIKNQVIFDKADEPLVRAFLAGAKLSELLERFKETKESIITKLRRYRWRRNVARFLDEDNTLHSAVENSLKEFDPEVQLKRNQPN